MEILKKKAKNLLYAQKKARCISKNILAQKKCKMHFKKYPAQKHQNALQKNLAQRSNSKMHFKKLSAQKKSEVHFKPKAMQ